MSINVTSLVYITNTDIYDFFVHFQTKSGFSPAPRIRFSNSLTSWYGIQPDIVRRIQSRTLLCWTCFRSKVFDGACDVRQLGVYTDSSTSPRTCILRLASSIGLQHVKESVQDEMHIAANGSGKISCILRLCLRGWCVGFVVSRAKIRIRKQA